METLLEQPNEIISQLRAENEVLRNELLKLREQMAWFQRQVFGQKKETFIAGESTPLIPGMELPVATVVEEPVLEKTTVKGKKKRKEYTHFEFPENAPREEEIIDLPEEEKEGLVCIGEDVTERLAIRKARFFVKVTRVKKYVVAGDPRLGIHTAKSWLPAIPGSRIDESLLAEILVNKYANHLPLYRICQMFGREGLEISRQTLSKLVIKAGTLLAPLGELLEMEKLRFELPSVYVLAYVRKLCVCYKVPESEIAGIINELKDTLESSLPADFIENINIDYEIDEDNQKKIRHFV